MIKFTIRGIRNPTTLDETDPIKVKIFYTEFDSEINYYSGSNMTLQPTGAPLLQFNVSLANNETGTINS